MGHATLCSGVTEVNSKHQQPSSQTAAGRVWQRRAKLQLQGSAMSKDGPPPAMMGFTAVTSRRQGDTGRWQQSRSSPAQCYYVATWFSSAPWRISSMVQVGSGTSTRLLDATPSSNKVARWRSARQQRAVQQQATQATLRGVGLVMKASRRTATPWRQWRGHSKASRCLLDGAAASSKAAWQDGGLARERGSAPPKLREGSTPHRQEAASSDPGCRTRRQRLDKAMSGSNRQGFSVAVSSEMKRTTFLL